MAIVDRGQKRLDHFRLNVVFVELIQLVQPEIVTVEISNPARVCLVRSSISSRKFRGTAWQNNLAEAVVALNREWLQFVFRLRVAAGALWLHMTGRGRFIEDVEA